MRIRRAPITLAATALAAMAIGAQGSAASSAPSGGTSPPTTGRALVRVATPDPPSGDSRAADALRAQRRARSRQLLARVSDRNGLEVAARSAPAGLLAVQPEGESLAELRQRLDGDPLVEGVRPEYRAELRHIPNDPAFLLHDTNAPFDDFAQWNLGYAGFPRAWDLSGGGGAEVAVIDTGVYVAHPDLAGRISGTLDCSGVLCLPGSVEDPDGHGTHVAGLACGDSDNGYGLASAGFHCSLYAISTDLTYLSIINSIYAAADHGADAINMSFGGGGPDAGLRDALDYAWARGSIPVAAAANEPTPSAGDNYPAQYLQPEGTGPNIDAGKGLVVTSVKYSLARSAFAQKTSGVSVAAFGSASDMASGGQQGILSTWPPETPEPSIDTEFENRNPPTPVRTTLFGDNRFAYLAGTSMATPQVAGLVALMRAARPSLPAGKLARLVKLTASNCGTYAKGIGWGAINADVAVGAAVDRDLDPPGSRVQSARRQGGAGASASRATRVSLRIKRFDDSCSEELPQAGLKSVSVFASVNGRAYRLLRKTQAKRVSFKARAGRRYRFYSVAVDRAGNHESTPDAPDAKLRVGH